VPSSGGGYGRGIGPELKIHKVSVKVLFIEIGLQSQSDCAFPTIVRHKSNRIKLNFFMGLFMFI
jgi:hypothetical protein